MEDTWEDRENRPAREVRREMDRLKEGFDQAPKGGENMYDSIEEFVRLVVEEGTMTPSCELEADIDLSLQDRLRGKTTQRIDFFVSIGIMIGTALERDIPTNSDLEDDYRDGNFYLPNYDEV